MKKIQGTKSDFARFKEDGGRFVIGYGLTQLTDTLYEWFEITIYKRQQPIVTLVDVKQAVIDGIDAKTDERILEGYEWTVLHGPQEGKTVKVWLSKENQTNFKAKHDRALQKPDSVTWPITYKVGEADGQPVYELFADIDELTDFVYGAQDYIEAQLGIGWQEKDSIDWAPYEALFPAASEASAAAE